MQLFLWIAIIATVLVHETLAYQYFEVKNEYYNKYYTSSYDCDFSAGEHVILYCQNYYTMIYNFWDFIGLQEYQDPDITFDQTDRVVYAEAKDYISVIKSQANSILVLNYDMGDVRDETDDQWN